jgi:ABC-type lipoprotein release transport system permease subunit
MTLTFLNLVVVSGILVGLIEGASEAHRRHNTSDVVISTLREKTYIERSTDIIAAIKSIPQVEAYTARYQESAIVEANYKTKVRESDLTNAAGTSAVGIDPIAEDKVTDLAKFVVEGSYLTPTDYDQVLIGSQLLKQYLDIEAPGFTTLDNVFVGSKVRVKINGNTREVTVKGIMKSKVDNIDRAVFFVDSQLRGIIGRTDYNVGQIAIKLKPGADPASVRDALLGLGFGQYAKVQTFEDAQPKFLIDIKNTFELLGTIISSIGLAVACITIFIVIFINAITRRKFIGILKGIGINSTAIELAYVIQSIFYALSGIVLGFIIVFAFLKPYVAAHPIDFPFSDGILVATLYGTMIRAVVLCIATLIAGYIPAKIVVRQNTLDAILGR